MRRGTSQEEGAPCGQAWEEPGGRRKQFGTTWQRKANTEGPDPLWKAKNPQNTVNKWPRHEGKRSANEDSLQTSGGWKYQNKVPMEFFWFCQERKGNVEERRCVAEQ